MTAVEMTVDVTIAMGQEDAVTLADGITGILIAMMIDEGIVVEEEGKWVHLMTVVGKAIDVVVTMKVQQGMIDEIEISLLIDLHHVVAHVLDRRSEVGIDQVGVPLKVTAGVVSTVNLVSELTISEVAEVQAPFPKMIFVDAPLVHPVGVRVLPPLEWEDQAHLEIAIAAIGTNVDIATRYDPSI
jgi:hypothetical protein